MSNHADIEDDPTSLLEQLDADSCRSGFEHSVLKSFDESRRPLPLVPSTNRRSEILDWRFSRISTMNERLFGDSPE